MILPLAGLQSVPAWRGQHAFLGSDSRNARGQFGDCLLRGLQAPGRQVFPRRGSGWTGRRRRGSAI